MSRSNDTSFPFFLIILLLLICGAFGCAAPPEDAVRQARAWAVFDSTMTAQYNLYEVTNTNGTTYRVRGHALIARDGWGNSSWIVMDHKGNTLATGGAGTTAHEVQ